MVSTDPCASRTARLTKFSEAINSIESRWRLSSLAIAAATAWSAAARPAALTLGFAVVWTACCATDVPMADLLDLDDCAACDGSLRAVSLISS
ncbi:hypothetical protein M9H71_13890 [Rhodopseudomonas parapalustris]